MTLYQLSLMDEAKDMWSRGFDIPTDLFAKLAAEGFDVLALEAKHKKEAQ